MTIDQSFTLACLVVAGVCVVSISAACFANYGHDWLVGWLSYRLDVLRIQAQHAERMAEIERDDNYQRWQQTYEENQRKAELDRRAG